MSYQALARKWRPRLFSEVVGQEHVVQALSNALDNDRVHHAFLFTGTRGVGKTTLARILSKALNCEKGISSTPCNECASCTAIDDARFVDLIEVDAASRTKVDDTRELLDNVQYAPTLGRYKVYLIDEVHMLSGHSFNALLKTLEEPPPHVKFLLATTDRQKLPVTVLSRCLQFNLKALQPDQISTQLGRILESEHINTEAPALDILARAADGSMRDALSLLDQALAHGGGEITQNNVRTMLGSIENKAIEHIVRGLAAGDAKALLGVVDDMAEQASDYVNALNELLLHLYYLSLRQQVPDALSAKQVELPWHLEMADKIPAEELQLYYQIGLVGKRDITLAPDLRSGFEMVLLRMLSFQRTDVKPLSVTPRNAQPAVVTDNRDQPSNARSKTPVSGRGATQEITQEVTQDVPQEVTRNATREVTEDRSVREDTGPASATTRSDVQQVPPDQSPSKQTEFWSSIVPRLKINGLIRELAMNVVFVVEKNGILHLLIHDSHEHLLDSEREKILSDAVSETLGREVRVKITVGEAEGETLAEIRQREQQQRQERAVQAIQSDRNVQALQDRLGATIIQGSIQASET